MDSAQPTVRYYDARRTRPWFDVLLAGVIAACRGGGVVRHRPAARRGTPVRGRGHGGPASSTRTPARQAPSPSSRPAIRPRTASMPTSVVMVGDSITAGSADVLRYTLAAHGVDDDVDRRRRRAVASRWATARASPLVGHRHAVRPARRRGPTRRVGDRARHQRRRQYGDADEYAPADRQRARRCCPTTSPLVWVDTYRPTTVPRRHRRCSTRCWSRSWRRDEHAVVAAWFDVASATPTARCCATTSCTRTTTAGRCSRRSSPTAHRQLSTAELRRPSGSGRSGSRPSARSG